MREAADGVIVAVPLSVPLVADSVLGPRLVYGTLPIRPDDGEPPVDALLFPSSGPRRRGSALHADQDVLFRQNEEHEPLPKAFILRKPPAISGSFINSYFARSLHSVTLQPSGTSMERTRGTRVSAHLHHAPRTRFFTSDSQAMSMIVMDEQNQYVGSRWSVGLRERCGRNRPIGN